MKQNKFKPFNAVIQICPDCGKVDVIEGHTPAFPSHDWKHKEQLDQNGMTLLDYFASKAMQGIIASPGKLDDKWDQTSEHMAKVAYNIAEWMLKEREKYGK